MTTTNTTNSTKAITAYDLLPVLDTRKSFYGKARIERAQHGLRLVSYSTVVAYLSLSEGTLRINGRYSNTTSRHICEFLWQHGIKNLSESDYGRTIKLTAMDVHPGMYTGKIN